MKILIAEDNADSCQALEKALEKLGHDVVLVNNGREALEVLTGEDPPRFAVLDWTMPELSGAEVCQAVRSNPGDSYTYILLVTARSQKTDVQEGMNCGADDYIKKPFDFEELGSRLRMGCRILQLQEQLLATREAYRFQATHDSLTGLWNHKEILAIAERELMRSQREGTSLGLILADLDHFKMINDRFGHLAGDEVLGQLSDRLSQSVRSYDFVGRYGGEEFLFVIPGCDARTIRSHAERLRKCVAEELVTTDAGSIPASLSLGAIASAALPNGTLRSLLLMADDALYRAKRLGRNRVETACKSAPVAR